MKEFEEEKDMAVGKEDLKDATKIDRKNLIRSIAKQICDENDEGLRKLSKENPGGSRED
jgi:hypothetical protein